MVKIIKKKMYFANKKEKDMPFLEPFINEAENMYKKIVKETKRIGVLSPTLDKKRQQQCLDCASGQIKPMYVISSKKFKSINDALAQMVKWDKAGTLSKSAHVYEVVHALRIEHKKPPKKKIRKYKGGGYVIEEKPQPGITILEMNSKGWYEEFAKPLLKKKK